MPPPRRYAPLWRDFAPLYANEAAGQPASPSGLEDGNGDARAGRPLPGASGREVPTQMPEPAHHLRTRSASSQQAEPHPDRRTRPWAFVLSTVQPYHASQAVQHVSGNRPSPSLACMAAAGRQPPSVNPRKWLRSPYLVLRFQGRIFRHEDLAAEMLGDVDGPH